MKKLIALLFAVVLASTMISGCATIGANGTTTTYVTCEEAVAYIVTVDAALAALPVTQDNAVVIAWYKVARAGAMAYLSRKCPDVVSSVTGK